MEKRIGVLRDAPDARNEPLLFPGEDEDVAAEVKKTRLTYQKMKRQAELGAEQPVPCLLESPKLDLRRLIARQHLATLTLIAEEATRLEKIIGENKRQQTDALRNLANSMTNGGKNSPILKQDN